MISPELLRRLPFFAPFSEIHLKAIAMISEEDTVEQGVVLLDECGTADRLYFLLEGSVELFYTAKSEKSGAADKEYSMGDINPGEVFSISALIEPYVLSANARTTQPSRIIKIDAPALRQMFVEDSSMGFLAMSQISKALMERLAYTRIQLAAAWA
ncbi:MAG: cyclic nucleotide-binding domain-containing protein [Anaerolineales bacterium]|nr:cyclic nucleotide-binding domain-containing protein [Anaerolineales bacterium]